MKRLIQKYDSKITPNSIATINYHGIDLLKIILAILITMLHLKPLNNIDANASFMLTNCYTRIAVPTFFSISGMLVFRNIEQNISSTSPPKNQVKRLWRLYMAWSILYLPQVIINYMTDEKYTGVNIFLIILSFIRRFFAVATWTPLWYFLACCYCIPLVYICLKHININFLLTIGFLAYIYFSATSDCYSWLLGEPINAIPILSSVNNTLFKIGTIWSGIAFGFLFMTIGHFAYCKKEFFNHKWSCMIIGAIVSLLLLRVEVTCHQFHGIQDMSMMLTLIPCSFFLLQIFMHLELKHRNCWIFARKLSVLTYGLHSIIAFFITLKVHSMLSYIIIMTIVIVLNSIIIFLSSRCKYFSYLQ